MTAKILDFATRGALIREARQNPPDPSCMMILAAEHERIAQNAERTAAAMDRLAELPSDTE